MTERFISVKEAARRAGISPRQIGRLAPEGKFPRLVQLTEGGERRSGRVGLVESEVEEWIESRIAARDASLRT